MSVHASSITDSFPSPTQEKLLLEPMFEVPGSDISKVRIEEDTARGYHPARCEYKHLEEVDKPDQQDQSTSDIAESLKMKTSII